MLQEVLDTLRYIFLINLPTSPLRKVRIPPIFIEETEAQRGERVFPRVTLLMTGTVNVGLHDFPFYSYAFNLTLLGP